MLEYILIAILLFIVSLQGWWIYKSLKKFLLMRDLYSDVREVMLDYSEHLERVHNMERFYGEPVLEQLIKHGKQTEDVMSQFLEVFADFEQEGELRIEELYEEEEQYDFPD